MFSERTQWSLEVNDLTRLTQERQRRGLPVLDLTESNPTRCSFDFGDTLLEALVDPRTLRYEPDPRGLFSARQAVIEYYAEHGVTLSPNQIFLTASTSEAYSFIFRLLGDPGDEVLTPNPGYPLFDFLMRLNDLRVAGYPLVYDQGWHIDQSAFESVIGSKSRALLVVHPSNPTGSYVHVGELDFLVESCRKHEMSLISDEVFFDYVHPEKAAQRAPSFAGEKRILTFTLSGLSKICALPQMKCAWIVVNGPAPLLANALDRLELIADTYLSLSAPIACALPKLLNLRREIQPQIRERLRANLLYLDSLITPGSSVSRLRIEGGWYAILRLPSIHSDEDWALRLLREDGVLVHPGHFYDFTTDGYVVVSLLPQPDVFSEAADRLLSHVKNNETQ